MSAWAGLCSNCRSSAAVQQSASACSWFTAVFAGTFCLCPDGRLGLPGQAGQAGPGCSSLSMQTFGKLAVPPPPPPPALPRESVMRQTFSAAL